MTIDLRRCVEAAAHAALAEAFARTEPQPAPPPRRRLRASRAVLLGAGVVTAARLAMDAELRKAMTDGLRAATDGLLRRLPLEEILEDLDLEREFGLELDGAADAATHDEDKAGHDASAVNAAAS